MCVVTFSEIHPRCHHPATIVIDVTSICHVASLEHVYAIQEMDHRCCRWLPRPCEATVDVVVDKPCNFHCYRHAPLISIPLCIRRQEVVGIVHAVETAVVD